MTILRIELKLEWNRLTGGCRLELCTVNRLSNQTFASVWTPLSKNHENFGQWWGICNLTDSQVRTDRAGKWFPTCEEAQAHALKGVKRYVKKHGGSMVEIR